MLHFKLTSQDQYNINNEAKLLQDVIFFCFQNEYEQLNYAKQLKERLEAFTRDFLPHMKEEEEVSMIFFPCDFDV